MTFRERGIADSDFGVRPLDPTLGMVPGVAIVPEGVFPVTDQAEPKKADSDGYYTIHDDATGEDHQFFVAKGDPIPAESTGFTAKPADEGDAEAKPAEQPRQQRTGPSETR